MSETTRRGAIAAATIGATAVAMTGKAAAQEAAGTARPAGPQDPRDKYPKPPFQSQQQPWPGLASQMDPRPDHGETSYVGSGRLRGRKALITGGDSGMGRARRHRLCARGRRRRDQLPARGGARRARGGRPDPPGRPQGGRDPRRPPHRGVLPRARRPGGAAASAGSTSWSATPGGSNRSPRSSTSPTRNSTRR